MIKKRPLILLDRDGVINHNTDDYIKSPDEWCPIPGSLDAIADLNRAGFRVIVVSNQSGIARGFYTLSTLSDIHEKFIRLLAEVGGHIDDILFCPHHPSENCACRKPKLGLFRRIQEKYHDTLENTFFIGDSLSDMQAALALPCKPLLALTGNGEKTLRKNADLLKDVPCKKNLLEAVQYVLQH